MSQFEDTREAVTTIGELAGPEATGMLVAYMEANARHLDWVEKQVRGGLEHDVERWKARALDAERRLAWIEARVLSLIAPPPTDWDPMDVGP